jgi:uncharacterized protein
MQEWLKSDQHPFISLVYLVLLAVAGAVIFSVIGVGLSILIFGFPGDAGGLMTGDASLPLDHLKIIQIFSSIGMFLLPPVFLARIESHSVARYLKLSKKTPAYLLGMTVLIMISIMPLLDLTVQINQAMKLPGFLAGVEEWMRQKEKELEVLTRQFLVMNSWGDLALNLFMIAALPALGEELMFRGGLQRIFTRWFDSYHTGIWIAAIIFSAIHVQFYGFIPRMLLGALFGYLLVWSNTMWVPVLGHFLNNGLTVVAAFVYQRRGQSLDELTQPGEGSFPLYFSSFVVLLFLLYMFYRYGFKVRRENEGRLA